MGYFTITHFLNLLLYNFLGTSKHLHFFPGGAHCMVRLEPPHCALFTSMDSDRALVLMRTGKERRIFDVSHAASMGRTVYLPT